MRYLLSSKDVTFWHSLAPNKQFTFSLKANRLGFEQSINPIFECLKLKSTPIPGKLERSWENYMKSCDIGQLNINRLGGENEIDICTTLLDLSFVNLESKSSVVKKRIQWERANGVTKKMSGQVGTN